MSDAFTVPVARHDELGTIVAANVSIDPLLLEQLRQSEVRGELRCAACEHPVSFVDATQRARHFRHRADAACVWGPESVRHLAVKDAFVRIFKQATAVLGLDEGWTCEVVEELPGERRLWQADVACTITAPDGTIARRLMVEVQQSPQSVDDTMRRTRVRQADGWDVLWVHFDPARQTAPRWLAEAAPTLLLDITDAGALRVVAGHLEQVIFHLSDIPTEPAPGPGEDDPVVVDSYDTDPEFLSVWIWPWMRGSGLLTDPPDGRHGYAWMDPPEDAPVDPDLRVLVHTYRAYAWQQQEAQARHAADETARRSQLERQSDRSLRALRTVLHAVGSRAFNAKFPGVCLTCGTSFAAGERVVLVRKGDGPSLLVCSVCREDQPERS